MPGRFRIEGCVAGSRPPRSHFLQLARTEASTLKQFLAAFPVSHVEINDPGLAVDIDYPDDYQKALRLYFDSPSQQ